MERIFIHLGEHLADELKALGLTARRDGEGAGRADGPDQGNHPGQEGNYGRHGLKAGPVVRHGAGCLDELAKEL